MTIESAYDAYDSTVSDVLDFEDPYTYEIREARNYFALSGYINWIETPSNPLQKCHGPFPKELLGKMPFFSRFFYKNLPELGKYMYVEKDKIHLVVICDKGEMKRFKSLTQSVVSLFVSFLGVMNKNNERICTIIHPDNTWIKDFIVAKCSTKIVKNFAVIVNTFYPITQSVLEENDLHFHVDEELQTLGTDETWDSIWENSPFVDKTQ